MKIKKIFSPIIILLIAHFLITENNYSGGISRAKEEYFHGRVKYQ